MYQGYYINLNLGSPRNSCKITENEKTHSISHLKKIRPVITSITRRKIIVVAPPGIILPQFKGFSI